MLSHYPAILGPVNPCTPLTHQLKNPGSFHRPGFDSKLSGINLAMPELQYVRLCLLSLEERFDEDQDISDKEERQSGDAQIQDAPADRVD